jgi:hypothetical protein
MKKLILIMIAAFAVSCNDANRTSDRDDDHDGLETEETLEPNDTTSVRDRNDIDNDRIDEMDDESGTPRDTAVYDQGRENNMNRDTIR